MVHAGTKKPGRGQSIFLKLLASRRKTVPPLRSTAPRTGRDAVELDGDKVPTGFRKKKKKKLMNGLVKIH